MPPAPMTTAFMPPAPANALLKQIADIRGFPPPDWWPLAPGWWIAAALIVGIIAAAVIQLLRRRAWRRSWKGQASHLLAGMEARLDDRTARSIAAEFSVTLRRIAMQRLSRAACAGLEGAEWLEWLTAHDPRGFDWTKTGRILTDTPYAPAGNLPSSALRPLLRAAGNWVR